jgi:hypothetical protein
MRFFPTSRAGNSLPCIALDFGGLDSPELGEGGQLRYCVDLVRGLAELKTPVRFLVLGARPKPLPVLKEVFASNGGQWRYRQFQRSVGRGSFYRDMVRMGATLWWEGIDLCHCLHSTVPMPSCCPLVMTQHDLMFELFPEYREVCRSRVYRINRWAVRYLARRVICISATTAADLRRLWKIPGRRIDVVHHGTAFTQPEEVSMSAKDRPLLVSPYNLEPRKNLPALLEAFAGLRRRYPAAELVLFGRAAVTPDRERDFWEGLRSLGLEGAVRLTGFLSDADLKGLYQRATVFVFPSLYEGFGYPVLEAMACGACVVARNNSSMAEIVGEAGLCLETADPRQLEEGLSGLLGDPTQRARLAAAARERSARFTVRRMAAQTLSCYLRALGRKPVAAAG